MSETIQVTEQRTIRTKPGNRGDKNGNWNGGTAEYPDHYRMKIARLERLKMSKGKCEVCGEKAGHVHHIDESNANHAIENLIALCHYCHRAVHAKEDGDGMPVPDDTLLIREFIAFCLNNNFNRMKIADRLGRSQTWVCDLMAGRYKRLKPGTKSLISAFMHESKP